MIVALTLGFLVVHSQRAHVPSPKKTLKCGNMGSLCLDKCALGLGGGTADHQTSSHAQVEEGSNSQELHQRKPVHFGDDVDHWQVLGGPGALGISIQEDVHQKFQKQE
uniref:Uncharacterized protein n=1 Tax=Eutreptiella gymnastica TaxID=73025 RepID=A0A7S4C8J2_9EUGL